MADAGEAKAKGAPKGLFGNKKKPKAKANLNAAVPEPVKAPPPKRVQQDGEADGWEREFRQQESLLEKVGLRIHKVKDDGNCLFRALAHQLLGDEEAHAGVREEVVKQMKAHREEYEVFMETPWEEYLATIGEDGAWGGHLEIKAAMAHFGATCLIHMGPSKPVEIAELPETSKCAQVSFHALSGREHYNSVVGKAGCELETLAEVRKKVEVAAAQAAKDEAAKKAAAAGGGSGNLTSLGSLQPM
mmetsp:Transcript_86187/g.230844  ORF Transcript_86187/g.230844 Transcript_86187/m.230844 type:complete len:245 (-) Transcript_86187:125-859(-)